ETYGDIKETELLSPYQVTKVFNSKGELGGYIEVNDEGQQRELPLHMVIEFREINPFNMKRDHFALVDAAKGQQYLLKAANAYTGKSLENAKNIPALITTGVKLPDRDFANFRARVEETESGKPIFGNGSGSIDIKSFPNN